MGDALRYEWVRLTTVRSTAWLLGLAVVPSALIAGLIASTADTDLFGTVLTVVTLTGATQFGPLPLTAVFAALIGVLAVGHEYRHNTIRPTFTALPDRSVVLAAKLLVVAVTAVVIAIVSLVVNALIAWAIRGEPPETDGEVYAALIGFVMLVVLWALLGVAATVLARSTTAVMTMLFVLPLLVEPLLTVLSIGFDSLSWLQPVVPYLPFEAGSQLTQTSDTAAFAAALSGGGGGGPLVPVEPVTGGLIFTGFTAVILAAGWVLVERRDA